MGTPILVHGDVRATCRKGGLGLERRWEFLWSKTLGKHGPVAGASGKVWRPNRPLWRSPWTCHGLTAGYNTPPLKPSPALQVFVETHFLMYGLVLAGMDGAGMQFIVAKYIPMERGITCLNT